MLWSVLAALYPAESNMGRLAHYEPYGNRLDMTGIEYPVTLCKIDKFERQNNISINVFGFDQGDILSLYLTKLSNDCKEVDLLLLAHETTHCYNMYKIMNEKQY